MDIDQKHNSIPLQVLLGVLLCIFLTGLFFVITFRRPSVLGLGAIKRASSTRTAMALTSQALYGPFPTPTGPTATITKTPTVTPTMTVTPSNTASPTPLRFFIDTPTPRTPIPNSGRTSLPASTATSAPPPQPTQPQATQPPPQATQPPPQPTQPPQPTSPPPQPTQPPPTQPTDKGCLNPQGHPIPCH